MYNCLKKENMQKYLIRKMLYEIEVVCKILKKSAVKLQFCISIIFWKIHNYQQEKEALKKRLRSKISGLRGANCSQFVRTFTELFIHLHFDFLLWLCVHYKGVSKFKVDLLEFALWPFWEISFKTLSNAWWSTNSCWD